MKKELRGEIKYIKDEKEYHFVTEMNPLSNEQMYSFNNWENCYASTVTNVKNIIRDIKSNAKIISCYLIGN